MTTLKSHMGRVLIPLLPVNRRTFDVLRHEFRAWRTRIGNLLNPAYHLTVARLGKQRALSLNVGSGGKGLEGWVNVELGRARDTTLCLDIRKSLPLKDGSVKRILIEHTLEHVDFSYDVPNMLADYHRVLEPGGTLRVIVPDAQAFVDAYVLGRAEKWAALGWDMDNLPDDMATPMDVVNHTFHQGGEHLHGYDFDTLRWALTRAGFSDVRKMNFGDSVDPELAIDQENHAAYSLYVDAVK